MSVWVSGNDLRAVHRVEGARGKRPLRAEARVCKVDRVQLGLLSKSARRRHLLGVRADPDDAGARERRNQVRSASSAAADVEHEVLRGDVELPRQPPLEQLLI